MAEYIEKQKAIKLLDMCMVAAEKRWKEATNPLAKIEFKADKDTIEAMIEVVASVEATDVQPVKCGKWEQDEKGAFHHCSECESKTFRDVDGWGYEYQEYLTDYCFRCGAKMVRGDTNDSGKDT